MPDASMSEQPLKSTIRTYWLRHVVCLTPAVWEGDARCRARRCQAQRAMAWCTMHQPARPWKPHESRCARALAAEVGIRAAEGHIGKVNRWSLAPCTLMKSKPSAELLKRVSRPLCRPPPGGEYDRQSHGVYGAHRTRRRDHEHRAAFGGHSSNRSDGLAGCAG